MSINNFSIPILFLNEEVFPNFLLLFELLLQDTLRSTTDYMLLYAPAGCIIHD